jgi:myo-inositol 2-dehydrogenase/D-chiro-inositol 1-dehydrogenase
MRHYDPQHVAVKDAVEAGAVGRPLMFRGWHRNPREATPQTSAEVLINSAVHDFYSARWLLGQEVAEIYSGFGYEVGVEITGSKGVVSTAPHPTPLVRHDGEIRQRVDPDWLERFASAYILEVQAWSAAVATGRPQGPSAWDGYLTLAAALAGADSVERGAPVQVEIPKRPALYA